MQDKLFSRSEGSTLNSLRRRIDRFCVLHPNFGIPNLMLYIVIGNVIVFVLDMFSRYSFSHMLTFVPYYIFHGQIWRLFTYVFTYLLDVSGGYLLLAVVSLFCYYQFGKMLENYWGTCRFNLYYLTGVLLTDLAGLLLGYSVTSTDLNLSLFLAIATLAPDTRVLLMMFIPVKMKYMAWVYLGFTALNVILLLPAGLFSFYWLMPLVPLANYFLFFGSDIQNLFPDSWRYRRPKQHKTAYPSGAKPNANWAAGYQSKTGERPYRHKCTVCGRTDTDYPNLEFRYCSKCNGYYCYCMDHINNHVHIQ